MAIENLIDNASKYSAVGTTTTVSVKKVKDVIEIAVADQGVGIDEKDFAPVVLERGDAVIFSGLLVHRTGRGIRSGLRIACGARFDNVQDPTFVERGYPCAFRLHAETEILHPGFPTPDQVHQLFQ